MTFTTASYYFLLANKKQYQTPLRWRSGSAFASQAGDQCSIPGRDRPKCIKQVVIAPLPNARQQVWVSRVLGDDHYKGLARVKVGIARLTAQWPCSSAEYRSKFVKICSSSGDVSKRLKHSRVGRKHQTTKVIKYRNFGMPRLRITRVE